MEPAQTLAGAAELPWRSVATASVAVPVPIATALSYAVPATLEGMVQPGCRVRVEVGRRRLVGVVMAVEAADARAEVSVEEVAEEAAEEATEPLDPASERTTGPSQTSFPDMLGTATGSSSKRPAGPANKLKPILEVLDAEPVVPAELLELARFVATYYLAPIGEAARLMVPSGLPPWGERRVSVTDGGALASYGEAEDRRIIDFLIEHRRCRVAELQAALG